MVHVSDVGEVHAAAVEAGQDGERYIVGGENIHVKEAGALVKKLTGEQPVHLGITGPLSIITASIVELFAKLTGSEPSFDPQIIRDTVGRYNYLDCSSFRQEFGLTPRPVEEILRDTVRWLLHLGAVKPAVAERIAAAFPPDPEWVMDAG
jgi:dihydroflavonol-4-reductase